MKSHLSILLVVLTLLFFCGCRDKNDVAPLRQPVDTVGFASYDWQMDSIINRIERYQSAVYKNACSLHDDTAALKVAISPHDDYAYVGYLYPALLSHIRSKVIIVFGVGHKAKKFNLEDKIVMGSFGAWKSPAGTMKISGLQNTILKYLPEDMYIIHDSLQMLEHSIEALVPYIEYYNKETEIIPVIIPYMSPDRIEEIASALAEAITRTMNTAGLKWGEGWSLLISTDAVHYGNEEWGGKNYDRFGVDSSGYRKAVDYENKIINETLSGILTPCKVRAFYNYTVHETDYHEYKWTWCGRYSVPFGLMTAYNIAGKEKTQLTGTAVGYSTSIEDQPLPVSDLGMGVTAPARLTHWVGYAAVVYR